MFRGLEGLLRVWDFWGLGGEGEGGCNEFFFFFSGLRFGFTSDSRLEVLPWFLESKP